MLWESLLLQYSSIPVFRETPGSGGHEPMHLIQRITNISQVITNCTVNQCIHSQVMKSINTHRQTISTNHALLYIYYLTSGVINCYDFWMPNGIIRYTSLYNSLHPHTTWDLESNKNNRRLCETTLRKDTVPFRCGQANDFGILEPDLIIKISRALWLYTQK